MDGEKEIKHDSRQNDRNKISVSGMERQGADIQL